MSVQQNQQVPETHKISNIIFTFTGLTLSVTAFLVGTNVSMNLPLSTGFIALIIGNTILALYAGFIGVIGNKTHESSTMISKPVFGSYGQIVTSTIVVIFLMGFVAVYSSMIGTLVHTLFPAVPALVGNLVFMICILATTISGFRGMSNFSRIGVPVLILFVIYGLYQVNVQVGLSKAFQAAPSGTLAFGLVISQVVAVWTSAATFSSDMTRFAEKPKYVFYITFIAFGCTALLETVALICALATGKGDIVLILTSLKLLVPAFFIYLLLMWTSAQSLLYSFSLAFINMATVVTKGKSKLPAKFWVVVGGVVALSGSAIMTLYGLTAAFNKFLLTIGIAIPAIGGILISHYFIVNHDFDRVFENIPSVRLIAFIAWILGIVVAKYVKWGIPALNGMLMALVAYAILGLLTKKPATKEETS